MSKAHLAPRRVVRERHSVQVRAVLEGKSHLVAHPRLQKLFEIDGNGQGHLLIWSSQVQSKHFGGQYNRILEMHEMCV